MAINPFFRYVPDFLTLAGAENTRRSYAADLDWLRQNFPNVNERNVVDVNRRLQGAGYTEASKRRRLTTIGLYAHYYNCRSSQGLRIVRRMFAAGNDDRDRFALLLMCAYQVPVGKLSSVVFDRKGLAVLVHGQRVPIAKALLAYAKANPYDYLFPSHDPARPGRKLTPNGVVRCMRKLASDAGYPMSAKRLDIVVAAAFGVLGHNQRALLARPGASGSEWVIATAQAEVIIEKITGNDGGSGEEADYG